MHLLIKNQNGVFTSLKQNSGKQSNTQAIEIKRPLPEDLGRGGFYNLNCRQGLSLCVNKSLFHRDYHAKITWPSPMVTFAFCLSGRTRTRNTCYKSPMEMGTGDAVLYYFKNPYVEQETQGGKEIKGLAVHFTPEALIQLASPFDGNAPEAEKTLLKALSTGELFRSIPMTQKMTTLLKEILTCTHTGMIKKLFLESRTLELTACLLELAFNSSYDTRSVSRAERERIAYARDILVSRLQFPPALPELASQVGMSHARLTRGFKKIYGCTVFEYLRNERLNYGRTLLQEDRLSITQVAFEAGFSGSSHFASAFQKAYGVSPSVYRKENPYRISV